MIFRSILLVSLLATPVWAQTKADPEAASGFTPKPLVTARKHMIVAAHPLAAEAGLEMMRRGGSAADAAIATLLVLNVVEPQSSGIGGGAFALVHGPQGLTTWDARETAPMAATPELFLENGVPLPFLQAVASGRSVGVPGLVRLMERLHADHGKLPWADLFAPAIRLAEDGFEVSPRLAASVARFEKRLAGKPAAALFLPDGAALTEGAVFKNPALGATLRRLANEEAAAFYNGPLAREIVAAVAAEPRPGALSLDDMAAYQVIQRPPVCLVTRTVFCGMGPPSSGATTVIQLLGTFFTRAGDRNKPGPEDVDIAHLFAEASRLAYADRARYLADPDQISVPVRGLIDFGYMQERARDIRWNRASEGKAEAGEPPYREGRLWAPDTQEDRPGTTHLSVIDSDGLAISLTASIETAFGSGRVAGGFLLNNQLTDFSFRPTRDGVAIANAPGPGKRPRSSMAPTMVYQGDKLVLISGSPGGSRIPEYVTWSLLHMLANAEDPARAVARPHVSHRNRGVVVVEPGTSAEVIAGLEARGHVVEQKAMTSGLHVIRIGEDGTLAGGADPRREGVALGE